MSTALVALCVAMGLQIFGVLFPIAFNLGERASYLSLGLEVLGLFALAPLLAAPLRRALGRRFGLVATVAGLVGLRLAVQMVRPVSPALAAAATAAALAAWALTLAEARPDRAALGVLLGLSLDAALRAAFRTWNFASQEGAVAVALAAAVGAAALLALLGTARGASGRAEPARGIGLRAAFLGPFLMLHVPFLQDPAFVASATGASLPGAAALVLAGDTLALVTAAHATTGRTSRLAAGAAGLALAVVAALFRVVSGPGLALVLLAAHPLAASLLVLALAGRGTERAGRGAAWRPAVGMALAGLGFLVFTLLYYIHYDLPLPFPNQALPPAAAVLLGLGAAGGSAGRAGQRPPVRLAAVPAALLLVPAALLVTGPDLEAATPVGGTAEGGVSFRLVDYNIHLGIDVEGQLDPEDIARVIEAQRPDVVVLQEVTRGWAIAGGIDLLDWLSARLEMAYVFGRAADGQQGNAILSRLPILGTRTAVLPRGDAPMDRSYLAAVLDVGGGRRVRVIVTHLHDPVEGVGTRLLQIDALLEAWGRSDRTLIAGDMNAGPGSPEIARFEEAGLLSAQDLVGDPALLTWPSDDPDVRIDWIFATPDLELSDFTIPRSTASDHLALAVTVSIP